MSRRHARSMSVVDDSALPMAVFGIANHSTTNNGKRAGAAIISDAAATDGQAKNVLDPAAAAVAERQAKSVLEAAAAECHAKNLLAAASAAADDSNAVGASMTTAPEHEGHDVDDDVPLTRRAFRPPTPTPSPTPGKHCKFCEDERPVLIHRRRSMRRASLLRSRRFGTLSAAQHKDDADTTAPQLKARLVTVVAEYDARASDAKKPDTKRDVSQGQPMTVEITAAAAAAAAAAVAIDSDSDSDSGDEEEDTGCGMKTFQFCMECFGCTLM